MIKKLEILLLNTTLVVEVTDHKIIVTENDNCIEYAFNEDAYTPKIEDVLLEFKGSSTYVINSDVTGDTNVTFKLKTLDNDLALKIQRAVLVAYLPHIGTIAKSEDSKVLIQSSYLSDNPRLTITAGLLDDIQVVLFDMQYKENERR